MIYVAAMVGEKIGEPTPTLYGIPSASGSAVPVVKTLWKGERSRRANDMSSPLCDSTGISFVVRERSKATPEVVSLGPGGAVVDRRPITIQNLYSAGKWISIGQGRRVLADNQRLFVVGATGDASQLPIPGITDQEAILDLCALQDGRGFALLTMNANSPIQRVRRFDAKAQVADSREFPGSFGSLSCASAGNEIQMMHIDVGAGKFVVARLGPGLAPTLAEPLVVASVASMSATGASGRDATFWALNSGMRSRLYEVSGKGAPTMAWAEKDVQRWGTTVNPPVAILVGGDAIVLVMESIDRSAGGSKVLRVIRLAR